MAQQTAHASVDARERVLSAAAELFAERGYHGTSVRDIAAACGLKPSSLYSHVPDKSTLLADLVMRYLGALEAALEASSADPGGGPSANRVEEMVRASVGVALRYPREFLCLSNSWTYIRRTPSLATLVARRDAVRAVWQRALREAAADGSLRADVDPESMLRVVFAATHGVVDRRYDEIAGPADEGDPAGVLAALLLDGFRPRGRAVSATVRAGTADAGAVRPGLAE
ncbi:TetR/AcrR family transcriptional regulator [Yinghuangia aomiensis]|uniref:TetR/AcrR family transcriptional regulator n=1 Tax=Yinghuangia aomiensis TaxID=676205 RepID=A0ABP9HNT4_9ACTN